MLAGQTTAMPAFTRCSMLARPWDDGAAMRRTPSSGSRRVPTTVVRGSAGTAERRPVDAPVRPHYGRHGAVVTQHGLASEAGIGILRAGGSAVDAAIAANAALAVVAPHSCGLGGDAFWLIWDGAELHGLNGSGRSGAAATLEAARAACGERLPLRGPWSVTVPGAIRSWGDAHARFGRLPWATLLEPAIELAEGFPAGWDWVAAVERSVAVFGADSEWARAFRPRGRAWHEGEIVVVPGLATTLRQLAEGGADEAYRGRLATRAAEYLAARGAPIGSADLAGHASTWTTPIRTSYRGIVATSHPPNSCGPIALELLNVLGRFEAPPPGAFGPRGVDDVAWVHLGLEAARATLAERERWLTDPDAMAAGALEAMLSPERAAELAAGIDPARSRSRAALETPAGGGTVYLATADRWGGVVSLIESNYMGFGSGLVDPQTGIGYQNRGASFSLDPGHVNALAAGKRPMHTLTPGLLLRDGRPWVAHGSMGGEIQPQIFAQVVSGLVDGALDVATAVAAPRWAADMAEHHGPPTVTAVESRYHRRVITGLRDRGHDVAMRPAFDPGLGRGHAIELRYEHDPLVPSAFAAATDPRSEGAPAVW
jgi:gamma-glutamyltranspeptidase/glutathione hydrolase